MEKNKLTVEQIKDMESLAEKVSKLPPDKQPSAWRTLNAYTDGYIACELARKSA